MQNLSNKRKMLPVGIKPGHTIVLIPKHIQEGTKVAKKKKIMFHHMEIRKSIPEKFY